MCLLKLKKLIEDLGVLGCMKQDVCNDSNNWYLIQCKPKQSFRAQEHLTNQGYTCFHPTILRRKKVVKQGQAQIKTAIEPLFPHYLFILLTQGQSWLSIRSTRGVKKLVTFDGKPCVVELEIIEALKHHCDVLNGQQPELLYKAGDKVKITEGCFKELEAIVQAANGEERVILLLSLFNREHKVELPVTAVSKSA